MRLWGWWRKPKAEPVPQQPDPVTEVLVLYKIRPENSRDSCYRLWYDTKPEEIRATTENGWMSWPADRKGDMLSVPVENVAAVIVKPYRRKEVC